MPEMRSPRITIEHSPSGNPPDAAVIWLHGLGADGHDFEPIVPELSLPSRLSVRFIFPHAPVRPVTMNMGLEMRSWYDIFSIDEPRRVDEAQLEESCQQLVSLIEEQIAAGICSKRILVAGFSQGGAVVLSTALRYSKPLAGILALSTYIPVPEWIETQGHRANASIPIMMAHGTQDPVVPYHLAVSARRKLAQLGYAVKWREYLMPHAVCPEQIGDISKWMVELLADDEAGHLS